MFVDGYYFDNEQNFNCLFVCNTLIYAYFVTSCL